MTAEVRMAKIEGTLERIEDKLDTALDGLNNTISDHEQRLRVLKTRPGKRWESVVTAVITAIVAAIIGYNRKSIVKGGNVMTRSNWKTRLKAAGVRALKTLAQTAVATIGTMAVLSGVSWLIVGSASALAAILSLLTSIAGLPEVPIE